MTAEYINTHDSTYNYLLRYFLPELSDPLFWQDGAQEIEENERLTYCRHMAAWLPYQRHYTEIIKRILSENFSAHVAGAQNIGYNIMRRCEDEVLAL